MPLARIKRNSYKYGIDEALQEHFELGRKARIHGLVLESEFYSKVSYNVKKSFDYKDRLLVEVKLLLEQNPSFNTNDDEPTAQPKRFIKIALFCLL